MYPNPLPPLPPIPAPIVDDATATVYFPNRFYKVSAMNRSEFIANELLALTPKQAPAPAPVPFNGATVGRNALTVRAPLRASLNLKPGKISR